MTRIETENALITLMETAAQFARQYNPEINHVSMYWLDGCINITGMVSESGEIKAIELNAFKSDDGTIDRDLPDLEKTA